MTENKPKELSGRDRRVELRKIIDKDDSLVENDSDVLGCLSVGDISRIKYYPRELYGETKIQKTEIRYITSGTGTRFFDYHRVGLKILEQYVCNDTSGRREWKI